MVARSEARQTIAHLILEIVSSPRVSTMDPISTSQRRKRRNNLLSRLSVLIQALSLARSIGAPIPQVPFSGTIVNVRSPPLRDDRLLTLVSPGPHEKRSRSHRSRIILHGCMSSPRTGVKWETIG